MSFISSVSSNGFLKHSTMSNLSPAYEEALFDLNRKSGYVISQLVRSVIEAEQNLAEFEQTLMTLETQEDTKAALLASFINQITSDLAVMCTLVGKGFKLEIQPLIQEVNKAAKQSNRLQ